MKRKRDRTLLEIFTQLYVGVLAGFGVYLFAIGRPLLAAAHVAAVVYWCVGFYFETRD